MSTFNRSGWVLSVWSGESRVSGSCSIAVVVVRTVRLGVIHIERA